MKSIFFSLLMVLFATQKISAVPFYNQNGIKLNHYIEKEKVVYIEALKRNVIIWHSKFELNNNNKKAIAIRIPCYLCYTYSFLNPSEISLVQNEVPEYVLSDVYKNYVAKKPIMVNSKQTIISERYFATLEDVDLKTATVNFDFKFSFWI